MIFNKLSKLTLLSERKVILESFQSSGLIALMHLVGLVRSLNVIKPFVSKIIYEF